MCEITYLLWHVYGNIGNIGNGDHDSRKDDNIFWTNITVELENTTTYFYLAIWFNIIQFFVFLNPLYFLTFIFFLSLHFSRPAERQLMYANLNKIEI